MGVHGGRYHPVHRCTQAAVSRAAPVSGCAGIGASLGGTAFQLWFSQRSCSDSTSDGRFSGVVERAALAVVSGSGLHLIGGMGAHVCWRPLSTGCLGRGGGRAVVTAVFPSLFRLVYTNVVAFAA